MEQINKAISHIDTGTQENASKAQNTMQIADENDKMATSMVDGFIQRLENNGFKSEA